MKRNLSVAAASVLIGLAAPALGQQSPSEGDRQAVKEFAQTWVNAYNRQDAAGAASLYTDDAVRVTPQGILQGRDAIRRDIEAAFKAGGHDISITPKVVQPSGNSIWSAGEWSAKIGDQPVHGYWGNTVVREGDGLKIKYDVHNMTPAPAQQSASR